MARLEDVLAILRDHKLALNRRGVVHAGIFGSLARGSATDDSDVDVAIELNSNSPIGLLQYNALGDFLESVLGKPVDMAERTSVRQRLRAEIDRDYKHAF